MVGELGAVDDDGGVRVVQQIDQLVVDIAVVDVDVGQPGFEAGGDALAVFGAVAQIEGDLVAGLAPPSRKRAGQVVGAAENLPS